MARTTGGTDQTCAAIAGCEKEGVGHEEAGWLFRRCVDCGGLKLLVPESRRVGGSGEDVWMVEVVVKPGAFEKDPGHAPNSALSSLRLCGRNRYSRDKLLDAYDKVSSVLFLECLFLLQSFNGGRVECW